MVGLADKRVGIIGPGDGRPVHPAPGARRRELFVFQRTPSSIDVRNNQVIDPEWFATSNPAGRQRGWLTSPSSRPAASPTRTSSTTAGRTSPSGSATAWWPTWAKRLRPRGVPRAYEDSDDEKMTEIRARVDAIVEDPATAGALMPWYRQLCKRPCFHDEYLQAYNEPGVHLVDTDGRGVERIDASGVWVAGVHYPLDCLIFASGFEVGTDYTRRSGFEVVGRDGTTLSEHWADGMQTLHGLHVHGFPNLFVVGPARRPTSSRTSRTTSPRRHHHRPGCGSRTPARCRRGRGQRRSRAGMGGAPRGGRPDVVGRPDCTPGYYNNEGRPLGRRERLNGARYRSAPSPTSSSSTTGAAPASSRASSSGSPSRWREVPVTSGTCR